MPSRGAIAGALVAALAAAVLAGTGVVRVPGTQHAPFTYKSVASQSIHYFARTHDAGVRRHPVAGRVAWRGPELASNTSAWMTVLTEPQRDELRDAVRKAEATGKAMEDIGAEDMPLPTLAPLLAQWRSEVAADPRGDGLGFHVVRGVPVDEWTQAQQELFFWAFGHHLGVPGAQNNLGHLLGHVKDIGGDPRTDRQYKTHALIKPHCDAADVVGLLCVQMPLSGGTSRLVSSVSVYNELLRTAPAAVVERLYEPFNLDTRGSGGVTYVPIEPVRHSSGGGLRTFYHTEYFRSWVQHADAPAGGLSDDDSAVLQTYDTIVSDPSLYLEMELQRGDIQLVSNHVILHARDEYKDGEAEEEQRHLLRLWLSLDADEGTTLSRELTRVRLLGRFAWGKVRHALAGWGLYGSV